MYNSLWIGLCALFVCISTGDALGKVMGVRNLANTNGFAWNKEYSTANGRLMTLPADQTKEGAETGLHIATHYEGKGFTYYNASPNPKESPLPGKVEKIVMVARDGGESGGWKVSFKVVKGEKGERYEMPLHGLSNDWKTFTFVVPKHWPRVTGVNISSNNWNNKTKAMNCDLYVSSLMVHTDITDVKDKAKLLSVSASTPHERNLFQGGKPITLALQAGSWFSEVLDGSLSITIQDPSGKAVFDKQEDIQLADGLRRDFSYTPKQFGVFTVTTQMDFGKGLTFEQTSRCASIPKAPDYTPEEQRYSPWAINIHGGMEDVAYKAIRELGFQWIRDYAYNYGWLARGRGNGDWGGWPWYLTMEKKRAESGLMLLPSIVHGIGDNVKKHREPPEGWLDDIIHLMLKFPQYQAFEVDNEVDLHYPKILEKDDWQAYGKYHAQFAKAVKAIRPNAWTVEQGYAGVKSHIVKKAISRGHYDDLDVINAHFYCGTSPALLAKKNANTGQAGEFTGSIFDQLRTFAKTADMDGKDRQAWLTEFGWDTLAVHIVDEFTQAAYTQRGYALALTAGMDKCFLYWNRDTKKAKPDTFFDGMGIFDPKDEPKPVAVAMSAMIHQLKMPKPIGTFYPGENAFGYVFEDRGRYVGMAFKIDPEKPGPSVQFASGDLFDMFANPIKGRNHTLNIDPIWIDGLKDDDPFLRQADWEIASNYYVRGAAGDVTKLEYTLKNRTKADMTVTPKLDLPQGWSLSGEVKPVTIKAGAEVALSADVAIDAEAKSGTAAIWMTFSSGNITKKILTEVEVVRAASMGVVTLSGRPGKTVLPFTLSNNSLGKQTYTVTPRLPKGWACEPASLTFTDMDGASKIDGTFSITWTNQYDAKTPAEMSVTNKAKEVVYQQGIVPSAFAIPKATGLMLNGDFADWPKDSVLPQWVIGTQGILDNVVLRAAYSDKGIYVGVEVSPSEAKATQPSWFWTTDTLEVCIDTQDNKDARDTYSKTDHQFWLVPLTKKNGAYLGRWKRNDEIPETQYDMANEGASKLIDNGYRMEALIPAAAIEGFSAEAGKKIGLAFALTVPSKFGGKAVAYWPLPKTDKVIENPNRWGIVELK